MLLCADASTEVYMVMLLADGLRLRVVGVAEQGDRCRYALASCICTPSLAPTSSLRPRVIQNNISQGQQAYLHVF